MTSISPDMIMIGVDTGGTFTDFIYRSNEEWQIRKQLSTPANPADSVIQGVRRIACGRPVSVSHGTTVATNALLESRGAHCGFITNAGFEDMLAIGRQNRKGLYDRVPVTHLPVISRENCLGISGRILRDGTEHEALPHEEVERVVAFCKEKQFQSVAVCLLFSFLNPAHEMRVRDALRKLGLHVSVSHDISREFREYERASTTAVNAYVAPVMERYIGDLVKALGPGRLRVMQSNGGSISPRTAMAHPVKTILSGPAGGVVAAREIAGRSGFDRIISFDMGGTSTDVCLVDQILPLTSESMVKDLPVRVPMIDIHTVGAGGGSLMRMDPGGALTVGPESAGADPGPVCYGKGTRITVTDANLFLGRMDSRCFLGGAMTVDAEKTSEVFVKNAREAGMAPETLAAGVIAVADEIMARAVRMISVERGFDPREFTLVSFGGGGGLHAVRVAENLSIPRVLVPRHPGVLSAMGMRMADVVRDYVNTVMLPLASIADDEWERLWQPLREEAVLDMQAEGFAGDAIQLISSIDMRYEGQSFELTVPFSHNPLEAFHQAHARRYGHSRKMAPVEVVNLRLQAVGKTPETDMPRKKCPVQTPAEQAVVRHQRTWIRGEWRQVPVFDRERLTFGHRIDGPAIITEYSATTFLPAGARLVVDAFGNLVISVPGGDR